MACDDKCRLEFDSDHPYGSGTPTNMQTILEVSSYMQFRRYQTKESDSYSETTMKSAWITLKKGYYYRIRGLHGQDGGPSHFTVSLEVKDAYVSGHPQLMREMQVFEIDQTQVPEVWLMEILNVKLGGRFYITFTSNDGTEHQTKDPFDLDIAADTLAKHLCN